MNDTYLKVIDTEEKAYLLGWIASDGSLQAGGITISIHKKDIAIVETLRNLICPDLPIKTCSAKPTMVTLVVSSKELMRDVARHLGLTTYGKKSGRIQFNPLSTPELTWAYIRGIFDGDGTIRNLNRTTPECGISNIDPKFSSAILNYSGIPGTVSSWGVSFYGNNAVDFLGRIYSNSKPHLRLLRKYNLYKCWATYVPGLQGMSTKTIPEFVATKTRIDAIYPSKTNVTDSGYDLTALGIEKSVGEVILCNTGIKINPGIGWYFDLVPRSSIIKTGYMLANSVGVIDRQFKGEILIPLIKVDKSAVDLEFPIKIAQLIPRPIIHVDITEGELSSLGESGRGDGSFGSTG